MQPNPSPASEAPHAGVRPRRWWLGLLVAAVGILWLSGARTISSTTHFVGVGPATMITLVGGGLVFFGALLGLQEWRGLAPPPEDDAAAFSRQRFALALAGLALPLVTIVHLGFVATVCGVFALVARAFGSQRLGFDLAIGAVIGLATWGGFSALGINLGPFLPLLR